MPLLLIPAAYVKASPGIAIVVKTPWLNRNPCAPVGQFEHALGAQYSPTMSPESLIPVASLNSEPVVPMMSVNKIAVIDLKTMTVAKNIELAKGTHPQEALVEPDGKMAFVSCDRSGQVAEIDTANWTVTRMIDTGKVSDGLAWAK